MNSLNICLGPRHRRYICWTLATPGPQSLHTCCRAVPKGTRTAELPTSRHLAGLERSPCRTAASRGSTNIESSVRTFWDFFIFDIFLLTGSATLRVPVPRLSKEERQSHLFHLRLLPACVWTRFSGSVSLSLQPRRTWAVCVSGWASTTSKISPVSLRAVSSGLCQ